jgi:Fe-S cluster assembly ATP-binding protein
MTAMLEIRNLHVAVDGRPILKGLTLELKAGEIHALMGPNGSGKSTLAYVLAGREGYEVTKGDVLYDGQSLLGLDPEERAAAGVFLAMQYPVEIPGVANMYFLRQAINALRKARGEADIPAAEFMKKVRAQAEQVGINPDLLKRDLNAGFSGGEKKRNEILQMAMLEPRLAVLDETDSGLDIDALRTVADGVNRLRSPDRGMLVITHYQRLLDYIVPDRVHILADGRIQRSGGKELALQLEAEGYAGLLGTAAVEADKPATVRPVVTASRSRKAAAPAQA